MRNPHDRIMPIGSMCTTLERAPIQLEIRFPGDSRSPGVVVDLTPRLLIRESQGDDAVRRILEFAAKLPDW